MKSRALLAGAGLAVLLTLSYTSQLLSPNHFAIFFHQFPLSSVYGGMLVDLIGISLVSALVFAGLERLNRRNIFWPILVSGILFLELYCLSKFAGGQFARQTFVIAGGVTLVFGFVIRRRSQTWFSKVVEASLISLALVGCSIFWIGPELLYLALKTSAHEAPGFRHPRNGGLETRSRVVWVVFDELSHDQVFDHRWPRLKLPNFDELREQTVSFTNVEPAARYTMLAMPSLLLGRPVSQITTSASAELTLYFDDTRKWHPFDASQTIFADARALGWTTGVLGWSTPYCRFLRDSVDNCYWFSDDEPVVDMSDLDPHQSILANALSPVRKWVSSAVPGILPPDRDYQRNWVASHERSYQLAMERALSLVKDPSTRFALIHLPVPHPPAIYSRKERKFMAGGSYVDNLALADIALGKLIEALHQTGRWPETTFIVCGDHSWRPFVWTQLAWTREDQAASNGDFDPRPVVMIHLAGERDGLAVAIKCKALALHAVLKAFLQGEIHSADDLVSRMREPAGPT